MISIRQDLCNGCGLCAESCPCDAIVLEGAIFNKKDKKDKNDEEGKISITPACNGCGLCVEACPKKAIAKNIVQRVAFNKKSGEYKGNCEEYSKEDYKDILVYVEHSDGNIAPVTLELIGKARILAQTVSQQVCCIFVGSDMPHIAQAVESILDFGVAKVYAYLHEELRYFRADAYSNVFFDCVQRCRPTVVLVGATPVGRSLAPRVATRCQTGLTADCTGLTMRANTDLVQTRPAFGGNIMAQIVTENHRPQFATVRERVMDMPVKITPFGTVEIVSVTPQMLKSDIDLAYVRKKMLPEGIEHAPALVVAGNVIKKKQDMEMLHELAQLLNGRVGATRPVVESGLADYSMQIGLSGRSVRPQLIITCGVSGAVQFIAGMKASEHIFAINTNPDAPIMKIADYAVVGNVFEIVPALIKQIKKGGSVVI